MKAIAMVFAISFMLIPLEAEIAELSTEGISLESNYCEITFSDGSLTFSDTDDSSATIMIQFKGTGPTEVTLSNENVLPNITLNTTSSYKKETCTAVFNNVIPGTYSIIGTDDPQLIKIMPNDKSYTGAWSA